MAVKITCDHCGRRIPPELVNLGDLLPCPACHTPIRVDVFPAWLRPIEAGDAGQRLEEDSQAACFYHPEKQAIVPCNTCGRFLCSLCDVDVNGQHHCPSCVDSGRKKGKLSTMENKRMLYDRLALMYAIWPILVYPFTLITAPYALFICIKHYRAPGSFIRPSKWRFWFAGVLATVQILGWAALAVTLIAEST